MYRTMEGTHYNSPEKAIQVWRLFCNTLFSRLVLTTVQEKFSLLLYLELSKIFSTISLTGDQRYSLYCCIWNFLKYVPLYLVQEIKDILFVAVYGTFYKVFSTISHRRSKVFSFLLYINFQEYFPLYLVQEIKDGKLGAFIWDSSRLEFEAAR